MDIALERFVDPASLAHVDEARRYSLAREASGGQRGPTSYDELLDARGRMADASGSGEGRAVEVIARVGASEVPVRVTRPTHGASRATYLDIHAGGFFLDSARRNDVRNAALADALGVTVVSVEYRLAPENPWPAAPDDCETAARWVIGAQGELADTGRVLVGGASSGATLAMTTLLRLRERELADAVLGAVLFFGAYDLSGQSPGGRLYADEWFIQAYAGHVPDRTAPDVSPLYGDLESLPATLLVVGTRDVLLEDNLAMAARLSAAGNAVELRLYPEAMHGFTSHPTSLARVALDGAQAWLADRLA
jgi:acetyl esterase/lipase